MNVLSNTQEEQTLAEFLHAQECGCSGHGCGVMSGSSLVDAAALLTSDWLRDHDDDLTVQARAQALRDARDDVLAGAPVGNETYHAQQVGDFLEALARRIERDQR